MIKYILHPGNVTSKIDGDIHYISIKQLIRLYKVNLNECIDDEYATNEHKNCIHLYPRYDGNYSIKEIK